MTIDYEARLESINKAIAAIEGGAQEYRIGSQSVKRAELTTLYAERTRIETILAQMMCSGTTVARLGRRR